MMNKHGGIYVSGGTNVLSLSAVPQKLAGFIYSTVHEGVVPDLDNNQLQIRVPGRYLVFGNIILSSSDETFDLIKAEIYKNGMPTGFISGGNLAGSLNSSSATSLLSLSTYTQTNTRFLDQNIHGALQVLATGQPLSSGVDIDVTKGTGKLILVLNAGSDVVGSVTITGDTVNRTTGAVTVGDSETILVTGLSTDTSDVDDEGNIRYALSDAYITSKWFRGDVTISTSDITATDVDVYHCSFEQFNDTGTVTLETLDINCKPTNTAAWLYAYLYSVDVVENLVDIHIISSLAVPAAVSEANCYYRLRESGIDHSINAATSGIFVVVNEGPDSLSYWNDISTKAWVRREDVLSTGGETFSVSVPLGAMLELNSGDTLSVYIHTASGSVLNVTFTDGNLMVFSK